MPGTKTFSRDPFGGRVGWRARCVRSAAARRPSRRLARLARAGLIALMVTVTAVVFLVLDVLAGLPAPCPLAAAVAAVYYLLWYRPTRVDDGDAQDPTPSHDGHPQERKRQ